MNIPARIYQAIDLAALRAPVDINLLGAVIWRESNFDPNAIGDNGHSVGLGQLHDQGAGAGLTVEQRKDPFLNAEVTARYLRSCLDATPDVPNALSAYNQGIGGWQRNRILPGQAGYIQDILGMWDRLKSEGLRPSIAGAPGAPTHQPGSTFVVDTPSGRLQLVVTIMEAVL